MSAADVVQVNALKAALSKVRAAQTAHSNTFGSNTEESKAINVLLQRCHELIHERLVKARQRLTPKERHDRARGAAGGHQP